MVVKSIIMVQPGTADSRAAALIVARLCPVAGHCHRSQPALPHLRGKLFVVCC